MSASGGDPVHVGRREPPSDRAYWEDRRRSSDTGLRETPVDVATTAGIVRRLQARVDRHRWLLDRMRSDPLQPEPAGLPELLETAARMRRDTESLLMLHGQDPGVPSGGRARRLRDVLGAAAAAAEEPRRVDVRSVPGADVTPAAATELLHVLAEVVDHVTAVYPGARVAVSGTAEAPGGVVVEVRADGDTRHDPDGLGGRRALGAARRLAQRSLSGIVLRSTGDAGDGGPVVAVHCPGAVVSLDPSDPFAFGSDLGRSDPPVVRDPLDPLSAPLPLDRLMAEPTRLEPFPPPRPAGAVASPEPALPRRTNGHGGPHGRVGLRPSQVDELFGPMGDLAHDPADDDVATPIFEAVASAWFREDAPAPVRHPGGDTNGHSNGAARPGPRHGDGDGREDPVAPGRGGPRNWETPSDVEWRAAAERAARPEPEARTSTGLPRRRPGNQLVPPRRDGAGVPEAERPDRVPDRVRDRLSTYQRGLRQGRHRADPTTSGPTTSGPAAW
jgi:hypothetical protein